MNNFSDFGIKAKERPFSGEKINIKRVLNTDIIVEDFRIVPSKFENKGECLHLQIKFKDEQRVIFNGGKFLLDAIRNVSREKLPFKTQIIEENKCYQFT